MTKVEEKTESIPNNIDISDSSHFTKIDSKIDIKADSNNNTKIQKLNLKSDENAGNNNNLIIKLGKNKKQVKNVIISDNVDIIQVESWKKYNFEQSVEPNIALFMGSKNEDVNKEENNSKANSNNINNDDKKYNKEDVKCTCLII